jgi:hypothetical protein
LTALDAALGYAARDWPVFPCDWANGRRKRPIVERGFHAATTDQAQITEWWRRCPDGLIGVPTGRPIGAVVLDVDVKDDRANGFDTLDELGFAILPETPIAHTASGGVHLYFALPDGTEVRNTGGVRGRGIGPGIDWRGEGGYVIAPSPASGYEWDPHCNLDTVTLAPVPHYLLPRDPVRLSPARPVCPSNGLSPYAEAALDGACRRIISAPPGEQESTLNGEAFAIGTLAGAGAIPANFALRVLTWAAYRIHDYDRRRPWRGADIAHKVERAFGDGSRRPREAQHA